MRLSGSRNIYLAAGIVFFLSVILMTVGKGYQLAVPSPDLNNALVILVNGQSNAVSVPPAGYDCAPYEAPHIITSRDGQWYTATCDNAKPGFAGALWVILGSKIDERVGRPIVILNEAKSGMGIHYFAPGGDNYTQLRHRVEAAGVNPDIIIFYQGETDSVRGMATSEWRNEFEIIKRQYLHDYPAITRVILIQIQPGCRGQKNAKNIMIAQRQVAGVTLIPTLDIPQREDNCHLSPAGIMALANRIVPFIRK